MRLVLFEPEIAGNVGAVLRLGACMGVPVDLIEPLGFVWDDRRVRRAAMDYIGHVEVVRHAGFAAFRQACGSGRLVLLTSGGATALDRFVFRRDDLLLFGKESAGVPEPVARACAARVRIPMQPQLRSMNLATSAGVALWEGLRQTGQLPGPV